MVKKMDIKRRKGFGCLEFRVRSMMYDLETWSGGPANPWARNDYKIVLRLPDGYDDADQLVYAQGGERPRLLADTANQWRIHALGSIIVMWSCVLYWIVLCCKPRRKYSIVDVEDGT